jgi:acyl carrier protein
MTTEAELIDYIRTEIAYDRATNLTEDEALLDGALDSTDVLRLVVHVEERYGVRIEDADLVPENFATVRALAELIRSKRPAT